VRFVAYGDVPAGIGVLVIVALMLLVVHRLESIPRARGRAPGAAPG